MVTYTFKKSERLSGKTLINNLFTKGNRVVTQFPFRILWQAVKQQEKSQYPARIMISVSKRNFKSAVNRNRIKRQIRELYRLRKHRLYAGLQEQGIHIVFSISYRGKEELEHAMMATAFDKLLNKLLQQTDWRSAHETPA